MGLQTAHSLLPSWSWSELACSYETSIEGGSTQAATQLVDLFLKFCNCPVCANRAVGLLAGCNSKVSILLGVTAFLAVARSQCP